MAKSSKSPSRKLTVGEMGISLAPLIGGDTAQAIRRVRHWTNAGLLHPEDAVHSGTGRHRRYSYDQLYRAAILLELSRFSIPVGVLEEAIEWADFRRSEMIEREKIDPFEVAVSGNQVVRLVFTLLRGRNDGKDHGWVVIAVGTSIPTIPHFGSVLEIELHWLLGQLAS
jgi:DNA-binding transcriptional MerR regulator